MSSNSKQKLGQVLTQKQLIKVQRIISCSLGDEQKVNALREYYNRPIIERRLKRKGWNPDMLAYVTISNSRKSEK